MEFVGSLFVNWVAGAGCLGMKDPLGNSGTVVGVRVLGAGGFRHRGNVVSIGVSFSIIRRV